MSADPSISDGATRRRFSFSRRLRITRSGDFDLVYTQGRRRSLGPLTLLARPNGLDHPRLGLSVPRRVGSAVRRNIIKRRLREAFRLMQHDLPCGYDLVAQIRPHEPLPLAEYQKMLAKAALGLHRSWTNPDQPEPR